MTEERLLFDQNKNPSVFGKPNDPNLTASDRYDHTDSQHDRYGYDHQANSQYGRYRYDHQADYQYS